ncbi:uncharacterized protein LOC143587835 [Bidens hawaiensis]|uniref:uncharacterized protein LOC143587835 n=1 Tax=Bidens hawaiensis TaxID=980011 RepID=UPI004049AA50
MGGGNFTYVSDHGAKLSKIDRVFVCMGFMSTWPLASFTVLAKGCSDHRPLLLALMASDFGHIPFRFFSSWLDLPGFVDFMESQCDQFRFFGPPVLALSIKLRWLKFRIKKWLDRTRMLKEGEYKENKSKIKRLEELAESRPLTEYELDIRAGCMRMVTEFEKTSQKDIQQKSRVRWAIDGDENSCYFHGVLRMNLSSNRLHGLYKNGVWTSNLMELKEMVFDFFS